MEPPLLFRLLDFKQLPPATSHPVFIVSPDVYNNFDFRVLQQNRRVVAGTEDRAGELNNFHEVLSDISWGEESDAVREFIVAAYVRGGACGVAQNCEYDGSTAIFTKRRYRDAWNRVIVRRCAKEHNHSLKTDDGIDWATLQLSPCALLRHFSTQTPYQPTFPVL